MIDFTIVEGKAHHCGQMVRMLRHEHDSALSVMGINLHRELRGQFDASCYRRAWLIDGRLAALGGVVGSQLAAYGFVWLAISEEARRYPVAMIKEGRRQLDEIMQVKRELLTTILNGDEAAKRFAIFLGFHVSHNGPGTTAHTHEARRQLAKFIDHNPDYRVPINGSYVITMGYHRDDDEQHEAA